MRPPYANAAHIESRVVQMLLSGHPLNRIATMEGMPTERTIRGWARRRPGFRAQIEAARAHGRSARLAARSDGFDAARAEAFLVRVRLGDLVRDLVKRPEGPDLETLKRWRRRPDFAAALAEAVSGARRRRRYARPYDEATGDRIVAGLWKGIPLPQVLKRDPGLPGIAIVRRWRRESAEFDTVLRMLARTARSWRSSQLRGCTPELTERVTERIRLGASLKGLGREPDMPCAATLYAWVRKRPEFEKAVVEACRDREDMLRDQAIMRLDGMTAEQVAATVRRIGGVPRRVSQMGPFPGERRRAAT